MRKVQNGAENLSICLNPFVTPSDVLSKWNMLKFQTVHLHAC